MKTKRILSFALALTMLLSLLCGTAYAAPRMVPVGEEPAYDPLAETASIAYEQHEDGYAVTLERAADSVTMHLTAVPDSGRKAEGARLYIRTGTALKAGTAYRVSFALWSEKALSEYAVCLDGGDTASAYGTLEKRSIEAGGTDRVEYLVTPEKESGELVLRLLLGSAEAGALRLSGLAVEESSAEAMGQNVMLVDKLNYNAPGSVTIWTNDDYRATLTTRGESATMTLTEVPKTGKEVWKAKLLVATGLRPEAGKTYRVRADLSSTGGQKYELCFNSGDTEKGYGALYNQSFGGEIEQLIYVPTYKTDGGELVIQFSVGNLSQGATVTLRDVRVDEVRTVYKDMLDGDFSFESSRVKKTYDTLKIRTDDGTEVANVDWDPNKATITKSGDEAGDLSVTGGAATLNLYYDAAHNNPWDARFNIDTGKTLDAGQLYRVSFDLKAKYAYSNYHIRFGTGIDAGGYDNDMKYQKVDDPSYGHWRDTVGGDGKLENLSIGAGEIKKEAYVLKGLPGDQNLMVSLFVGAIGTAGNSVTVSNLKIEQIDTSHTVGEELANVTYPESGSIELTTNTGNNKTTYTVTDDAIELKVDGVNGEDHFESELCIRTGIENGTGKHVTFKITADTEQKNWKIYCRTDTSGENWAGGQVISDNGSAGTISLDGYSYDANTDDRSGKLCIYFQHGKTHVPATYHISDIKVGDTPIDLSSFSSFGLHSQAFTGGIVGQGAEENSVQLVSLRNSGGPWVRKLYVDTGCDLTAGKAYQVSCNIGFVGTVGEKKYNVCFDRGEVEKGFDGLYEQRPDYTTIKGTAVANKSGHLKLVFELGNLGNDDKITISNISVKECATTPVSTISSFGSISSQICTGYTGTLTGSATDAVLNVWSAPASTSPNWTGNAVKLFIRTGVTPQRGKEYTVNFDIKAHQAQQKFHALYNGVADKSYGGEYELPLAAETPRTISHYIEWYQCNGKGELVIQLELGLIDQTSGNQFTVSNVRITEYTVESSREEVDRETIKAADYDVQSGYGVELTSAKDSATLHILKTPGGKLEAWKNKMFIDTGVRALEDLSYRVAMDVTAEKDMDFEVCYNRDNEEKGYDAVFDLHATGGKRMTLEKVFTSGRDGDLKIQLSLGKVPAENAVTVSNVRVERADYTFTDESALPAPLTYRTPGAVSSFVHNDYNANLTGSDDAITLNIVRPAANNPEPWKIKLFLDTGAVLEPGKFYKVTADLSAKMSQSFEIAYNNGGAESGYDFFGGLRLGGETQTVEKLLSVPADKKDAKNLMLQFNLGKTASPNAVTISNVTVEEVALSYAGIMKGFSYQKSLSTWTDPKTSYKASLDSTDSSGTIHITDVPPSGTGVWMTKLFARTGAMLQAGKSYQVRANLLAARAQDFEVCYNNEETEKGFDALYGQKLAAGVKTTVDKKITVPASMTDAGELVIQFSVGGAVANDITVSDVSVQEVRYGSSAGAAPDTVIGLRQAAQATDTLDVSREKLSYHMTKSAADGNAITMAGANLRAGDRYAVAFTAKADKAMNGTLTLAQTGGKSTVISQQFALTTEAQQYSFTTADGLPEGGFYDILWQFGSAEKTPANVELSDIRVFAPAERLEIMPSGQRVTVNGVEVKPDAYNINGSNYFKLRDLAMLLRGTDGQFVVRYNGQTGLVSLTTGKEYTPVGGELTVGTDKSTTCVRSPQNVSINGKEVKLKAYNIGGNNFFKLRDLGKLLNFQVDYIAATNTAVIASPLTPERQEAAYAYDMFFRPEIDGESQPFVGDTMPFYDDGTYYIYYLKEGGDSYNHSVYLTTTKDFVSYQEYDNPVLSASRADVQDSWIGTGSVVKADKDYYFFYTGFNASGSQEYHEKIMVAKGASPTDFTKVSGWEITPPAELNQKNDFRDPQAYYDPATGAISLTVTASKNGAASILKYTLDKDLTNVTYDGVIFTDPTGAFWNLECSDTFRIGDKWYLTYSGQEDAVWYATADSRFGPYSAPERMDGKLFYAGKHVEDGKNSYMIGWTRRSETASSTEEVSGWGGNLTVQKLSQQKDGSLSLVPVDSIASAFKQQLASDAATLTAGSGKSYKQAFTGKESYMLTGEFTYSGSGSFGLAFDFSGKEEQYKLVSVDPAEGKLKLSFNNGLTPIAETKAKLAANQKHTFTYIQDGSVGIFYLDGQAALTVRLYGVTDKPIYLFAENNSVTFTSLRQFTR